MEILDCTLRDGSYPINYAYSLKDTLTICKTLESAGVSDIEVGHGMGLGASSAKFGESLHSDLEYIEAAVDAVTESSIGVFAIAGVATSSQLKKAHRAGIKFVRVGADVDKLESTMELLGHARDLGLRASLNMMKTYAYPKELVLGALDCILHTDIETVSIVDSAGTMLPLQVSEYVEFLSQRIEPKIGFHGHNNLQLAIANSLAAAHAGASVLDATMRGIGRSSGNAQIEVLVPVLIKSGFNIKINYRQLTNFTDLFFQQPYPKYGIDGIELACGVHGLHSSFLPQLVDFSNNRDIDLIELIEEVTSQSLTEVAEASLTEAALKLAKNNLQNLSYPINPINLDDIDNIESLADRLRDLARKFSKKSVITLSDSYGEKVQIKAITFYGDYVIGHVQLGLDRLETFLDEFPASISYIGIDIALKKKSLHPSLNNQSVFVYDENQITELLLSNLISNLNVNSNLVNVKIHGQINELTKRIVSESNVHSIAHEEGLREIVVTVVTERVENLLSFKELIQDSDHLVFIKSEDIPDTIQIPAGANFHRLESRKHFDGNVVSLIESLKPSIITNEIRSMRGVEIVSSGLVAPIGTIVVDNAQSPTSILGVASGHGTLLNQKDSEIYAERIQSVSEELLGLRLRAARSGD